MKIKLTELMDMCGERLQWHPLLANVVNVVRRTNGESNVTFVTPLVQPVDAMKPNESQYLAVVIYMPRELLPEEYRPKNG
jgi:hypothetical protein